MHAAKALTQSFNLYHFPDLYPRPRHLQMPVSLQLLPAQMMALIRASWGGEWDCEKETVSGGEIVEFTTASKIRTVDAMPPLQQSWTTLTHSGPSPEPGLARCFAFRAACNALTKLCTSKVSKSFGIQMLGLQLLQPSELRFFILFHTLFVLFILFRCLCLLCTSHEVQYLSIITESYRVAPLSQWGIQGP